MLSLFGSLLGFGTSFLPNIMDYFKQKQDNLQELALMEKQIQAQERVAAVKLQEVQVDAGIREVETIHKEQLATVIAGAKWLANLSGSIRPVVTYLFVVEYLLITGSIAVLLIRDGGFTVETLRGILDEQFMVLLGTMLSFWFGNRTFGKRKS